MTQTKNQESKAQSEQTNAKSDQPKPQAEEAKAVHKRTGASKRNGRARYGDPVSLKPVDLANPARSAEAQEGNGRTAMAGGRTQRASAEANCEAFPAVEACYLVNKVELDARGAPVVALHGAKLNYERLLVVLEVAAMSAANPAAGPPLDDIAFVGKRRDSINRILPGISNAAARAKFGLHKLVRHDSPATLRKAAQNLLAGKKGDPKSRAAKLITADDEKRLKAIVKSVSSSASELKQARAAGVSRTTERDILNTALELFYDDFAASIGLVLEDDEVARLQALGLVPRKAERRAAAEEEGSGESASGNASSSQTSSGSASSAGTAAAAAPVTA